MFLRVFLFDEDSQKGHIGKPTEPAHHCQQFSNQHIFLSAGAVSEALPEFTLCDYPATLSLTYIASCFSSLYFVWYCEALALAPDFSDAIFVAATKSVASTDCPLQKTKQALWCWQCLQIHFCSSLLNREVHLYISVKQAICAPHPKSFRRFRPVQFIL